MLEQTKTVLVVDEEESIRIELKNILENAGYTVFTAENGQYALEKAQSTQFDVALIAINLPDIEGTELCVKLPKNNEMVKIVIASLSTLENGVKAADCGADDFLVKPIKPHELLDTIKSRLLQL
jgi:DNA-binding response OmpR family regulator